jgi:hypothetical protein
LHAVLSFVREHRRIFNMTTVFHQILHSWYSFKFTAVSSSPKLLSTPTEGMGVVGCLLSIDIDPSAMSDCHRAIPISICISAAAPFVDWCCVARA